MRTHGITHFTPDSCFGCRIRTIQIQPAPVFQPHFNQAVGQYVSTDREFRDALKRCSDLNSETTGTDHSYEPRYPGDTEPIREADDVLDTRARNLAYVRAGVDPSSLPRVGDDDNRTVESSSGSDGEEEAS